MFLSSGPAIADQIQIIVDDYNPEPTRFAVAYWGTGAEMRLHGQCRIVCDLESGACNPAVISNLRSRNEVIILKLASFHAKVVLGARGAVVSSANMSTNGLGAEGADAGTLEAGYFIPHASPDYNEIVGWFEKLWLKATDITDADMVNAQRKWELRKKAPPEAPVHDAATQAPSFSIDPLELLERDIDANDRLRAVKPRLLEKFARKLPDVDRRQVGKLATWAIHLVLNRAGEQQYYSAKGNEPAGPATDDWILKRFAKQKSTSHGPTRVRALLCAMTRDLEVPADARRAAHAVLCDAMWSDC